MPARPVKGDKFSYKLHSSRVFQLRNDPDFLTMIKIGRAMNAISFVINDIMLYGEQKTLKETLQYRRAAYVLGGYLHEAITVVDRVKGRYLGEPAFESLRVLLLDPEYRKVRKHARKIRNYLAFHLDELDERTQRMLSKLKPSNYTVMSADIPDGCFYFELSDYLDMAFIVDEFADGRSWEKTSEDVILGMQKYAFDFLNACHDFQLMIWKKKIAEHVY
jgi:hypothetical protein